MCNARDHMIVFGVETKISLKSSRHVSTWTQDKVSNSDVEVYERTPLQRWLTLFKEDTVDIDTKTLREPSN